MDQGTSPQQSGSFSEDEWTESRAQRHESPQLEARPQHLDQPGSFSPHEAGPSTSSFEHHQPPTFPHPIPTASPPTRHVNRGGGKPGPIKTDRANAWSQDRLPQAAPSAISAQDPFATPTAPRSAAQGGSDIHSTLPDRESLPPRYTPSIAAVSQDVGDSASSTCPAAAVPREAGRTIKPTLWLVYSQMTLRDAMLFALPGVLLSVAGGVVPTMMAKVIGKAFDAFTAYNPQGLPHHAIAQADKDHLMHKVLETVYILIGLAAATLVSSTLMISIWVCVGERVAQRLGSRVYAAVAANKMAWFDTGMGTDDEGQAANGAEGSSDGKADEGGIGPGGLMAKFVREIDDVRMATSRVSGELVQSLATCISGLALAFASSWDLSLVILAAIPVSVVVTIIGEVVAAPLLQRERRTTALASGLIERTVIAINTVKAFNAQQKEQHRFVALLEEGSRAYRKLIVVWAARFGVSATLSLAMFVQGFWYGSHLVQKGKISAGTVMSVFFSCLLVAGELVNVVESLNWIEKGKIGAANMEKLIDTPPTEPRPASNAFSIASPAATSSATSPSECKEKRISGASHINSIPMTPFSQEQEKEEVLAVEPVPFSSSSISTKRRGARAVPLSLEAIPHPAPLSARSWSELSTPLPPKLRYGRSLRVQPMRRARPASCQGEIILRNVSFSYPSRPDAPVLKNVDMLFPSAEITYVVGGSGSGKSTVAQLLLRIYEPSAGSIEFDDQMLAFLDPEWCKEHIAAVSQTPIVFDLSVHDNVALGLVGSPSERQRGIGKAGHEATRNNVPRLSRDEVQAACRMALLHDFVRDLPDGYDTQLGQNGASLSGGQKQRLAIARARIRDPTVLILDEATSALDPTSRLLVHEAIKRWRRGKTTIVITHDLSQVSDDDFVYFLEEGRVVEHGYRNQLERSSEGRFRALLDMQQSAAQQQGQRDDTAAPLDGTPSPWSPTGLDGQAQRALEACQPHHDVNDGARGHRRRTQRLSTLPLLGFGSNAQDVQQDTTSAALLGAAFLKGRSERQHAEQRPLRLAEARAAQGYLDDAARLEASGLTASQRRLSPANGRRDRRRWNPQELQKATDPDHALEQVKVLSRAEEDDKVLDARGDPTIRQAAEIVWRTVPSRIILIVGLVACAATGTLTPCFSYVLAQLLNTMGQTDAGPAVLRYSLLVLLFAVLEGVFGFARTLLTQLLADWWVRDMRTKAFGKILGQDRTFFDRPESSTGNLCTSIVKDADDARNLVAAVAGQVALVLAMVSLGLVWAVVVGWELTLAGMAIAPVFFVCIWAQNRAVVRYEGRNKVKREEVGKRFYDMVSNVRGIRAMSLEPVFEKNFTEAVVEAQRCGMRAAAFTGLGFGLGQALTYVAEAVMFLVGVVLIVQGRYDFSRMMQVFNLIIFAVTFAAHAMDTLPNLSKSMRAAADLDRLLRLPDVTSETAGTARAPIRGTLRFDDVGFRYASRPDVQVLDGTSFVLNPGECVAVVGGSGSGKSTIAALVQRLYEPTTGRVLLDDRPLDDIDVAWLREHISIVSQHPNLFDMSIGENILYGANAPVYDEVPAHLASSLSAAAAAVAGETTKAPGMDETTLSRVQAAAESANVDGFIASLPRGYATSVGESGGLISGGQAQRLAIARALMRTRARLLILDECTSALDVENQQAIVSTLMDADGAVRRRGMLTLVITHNLDMMKRCDSILVVDDGRIVQHGTWSQLVRDHRGVFATLARGGEWSG
ncbi:uncharacterized protein PFL1_05754 [Pseudozyma flocculosa PF-1]|uniref:Related to STE6 - ABC transporter n=2 Tax=Pseudozyma flocculosa TaxID=84751 RepID=A0A5C3F8Y4_9BASI|nr:uncharacterized protein PFL1_05754 [Pseudozyma flocculosa PF-1]EPQ26776.1 hypothetical protein PFL1_05754 [Pseudozyma flocculosa PF-1]SPO40898.1 related to STE6 - ABC transporter [Pseudozyma flocculosa]